MHRRRKQSGRRFERPERVCDKRSLSCPLSENRRPILTEVPCGHFWSHLLVTKGGKTMSLRRTCRPPACTTALRKARKKWRRRRHPRLFAVLDLLVLLGQAKSTKKNDCRLSVCARWRRSAPREPKPLPAEACHKGAHSAAFNLHFLIKSFSALSFEERAKEDREAKRVGKRTASR